MPHLPLPCCIMHVTRFSYTGHHILYRGNTPKSNLLTHCRDSSLKTPSVVLVRFASLIISTRHSETFTFEMSCSLLTANGHDWDTARCRSWIFPANDRSGSCPVRLRKPSPKLFLEPPFFPPHRKGAHPVLPLNQNSLLYRIVNMLRCREN